MASLNTPTPTEVLHLVQAHPANEARVGAVDAEWFDTNNSMRGQGAVINLETEKMRAALTASGLDWQNLTALQLGSAFNALCYACLFQACKIDYLIRKNQGAQTESEEQFKGRLSDLKDGIVSHLSEINVFMAEYCSMGGVDRIKIGIILEG